MSRFITIGRAHLAARLAARGSTVDALITAGAVEAAKAEPLRVDIDHAAYPQPMPTAAVQRVVGKVKPITGWRGLHLLAEKPVRDPYAVLAMIYGMTLWIHDRKHTRHGQWSDLLTAEPVDLKHLPAWANRVHNVVNARLQKPTVTIEQGRQQRDPIDLVYLWVDGSDPAWRAKYAEHVGPGMAAARFTDAGELQASLRSADLYAPWVRRIFVVTDNQRPAWLQQHRRVTVVDHTQIIPAKYLPTFNTRAIEPWIHRIPGLAERFLYANDDTLFGAAVTPDLFFAADGRPIVMLRGDARTGGDTQYANTLKRTADLLDATFGKRRWQRGWHHIKAYRRSTLAEIGRRFADQIAATSARRVRHERDINSNCILWPAYSIATGQAVPAPAGHPLRATYIGMGNGSEQTNMRHALKSRPHLLCVNNSTPDSSPRAAAFLKAYEGGQPVPAAANGSDARKTSQPMSRGPSFGETAASGPASPPPGV